MFCGQKMESQYIICLWNGSEVPVVEIVADRSLKTCCFTQQSVYFSDEVFLRQDIAGKQDNKNI